MRNDALAVARQTLETLPRIMGRIRAGASRTPDGLSFPQVRILGMLEHRGEWTMGRLAAAHNVSLPTMSSMVTTMERRGYVARESDPGDRRRVLVAETPAGTEALNAVRRENERLLAESLKALRPEDLSALTRGLAVLEATFPQHEAAQSDTRQSARAGGSNARHKDRSGHA